MWITAHEGLVVSKGDDDGIEDFYFVWEVGGGDACQGSRKDGVQACELN